MESTEKETLDIEKDLTINIPLDGITPPSEAAVAEMKAEQIKAFQEEYVRRLTHYMQHGDMPRGLYNSLPKTLRESYRFRFRNARGHKSGVPMSAAELQTDKKVRAKRKRKRKISKMARKANR